MSSEPWTCAVWAARQRSCAHGRVRMVFLLDSFTIFFVNLILSGDNGIMIALVMRSLPSYLRRRATVTAAGCAVIVRTAASSFAAQLLTIPFLKCAGGILIIFISACLFRVVISEEQSARNFKTRWAALGFVVSADLLMSTDNIVAIASIAQAGFWCCSPGSP